MNNNKAKQQIEKMMVVSTSHLPQEAYRQVSEQAQMTRGEDDLVYVSFDQSENIISDIHSNMGQLIEKAIENDCTWILFDMDGIQVDGITVFDWVSYLR